MSIWNESPATGVGKLPSSKLAFRFNVVRCSKDVSYKVGHVKTVSFPTRIFLMVRDIFQYHG